MSNGSTFSDGNLTRVRKRIIVCCDGTWQDGNSERRQSYTNILRLARTINHEDARFNPPIPQVVFYQSGIGSEKSFYSEYVVGTTGSTLADKVEEAYGFIAHNYYPGDEIFLFGFSRGAYTARMTALFIGAIGVLDRTGLDDFAGIFLMYQQLGKSKDEAETLRLREKLSHWTRHDSPGKMRADSDDHSFSVKFVGVFDTVGSLGLPEELTHHPNVRNIFGFNDRQLGEHIQYAYQALALNEPREDFNCCKFEQTPGGLRKGQVLRQCWFTGSHADIGGGYKDHDLADLTLFWMCANLEDHVSLDYHYLGSLPQPVAPWGSLPPHDPMTGIYKLASKAPRTLPTETDSVTHEMIHSSVLQQRSVYAALGVEIEAHPNLICPLQPLEDALRGHWPALAAAAADVTTSSSGSENSPVTQKNTGMTTESGKRVREKNWLGKVVHEIKSALKDK